MGESARADGVASAPPRRQIGRCMLHVLSRYGLSLMAAGVLAYSACFVPTGLPRFTACAFRRWTGLPCPGCGLTRSFSAISHGDVAAAWGYNPFAFPLYGCCLLLVIWPWFSQRFPRVRAWFMNPDLLRVVIPAFAIAMWGYGLVRLWLVAHGS